MVCIKAKRVLTSELFACISYVLYEPILGGINADNCRLYVENGASHVIVTSYVFRDGQIDFERLANLKDLVGKEHLVSSNLCWRYSLL